MKDFAKKNISITLLDDHFLVLRGLRDVLTENPAFNVTGTFTASDEFFNHLQSTPCHVAIVDYELAPSDMDGLKLTKTIHRRQPSITKLMFSAH